MKALKSDAKEGKCIKQHLLCESTFESSQSETSFSLENTQFEHNSLLNHKVLLGDAGIVPHEKEGKETLFVTATSNSTSTGFLDKKSFTSSHKSSFAGKPAEFMQPTTTGEINERPLISDGVFDSLRRHVGDCKQELSAFDPIQKTNEPFLTDLAAVRQKAQSSVHKSVTAITSFQEKIDGFLSSVLPAKPNAPINFFSEANCPCNLSTTSDKKDIFWHEFLLQQFFDFVGETKCTSKELLARFNNLGALYTAVSLKYNLLRRSMHERVESYLLFNQPDLAPATPLICTLHEGREVEFLELILLRSHGLSVSSPQTWLEIPLPASREDGQCYYYSFLVCLGQQKKPKCFCFVELAACRFPLLRSNCARLCLQNPLLEDYDKNTHQKILQGKAAALILLRRPDLQGNIDTILKSYEGREERLLSLIEDWK